MEGNQNGNEAKQEYQHKDKGVMENGRKDEGKKLMVMKKEWTRHLECGFLQDECRGSPLESSQTHLR